MLAVPQFSSKPPDSSSGGKSLDRRGFLLGCGLVMLSARAWANPTAQKIISLKEIGETWRSVDFIFERETCVLQRIVPPQNKEPHVLLYQNMAFVALSRRCPHAGCQTESEATGVQFCPCHGSVFDPLGKRQSGPSRLPLLALRLEIRQDAIFALGFITAP